MSKQSVERPAPVKNSLNGVWFSPDGSLHPQIIPNLKDWKVGAKPAGFEVVLWTNKDLLQPVLATQLAEHGIQVKDYSALKESVFYPYFIKFHKMGMQGDKAAFALASDIFRMAIMEQAGGNDWCIYADPNDVTFKNLQYGLERIPFFTRRDAWGFFFPVEVIATEEGQFVSARNDVLIAKKALNPGFFASYFKAYLEHLGKNIARYRQSSEVCEARQFALDISNQTAETFFDYVNSVGMYFVKAKFSSERATSMVMRNTQRLLPSARLSSAANTWVPKDPAGERAWLVRLRMFGREAQPKESGASAASKEKASADTSGTPSASSFGFT